MRLATDLGGFAAQETEEQMQILAEEVMPVITRECGDKVELPARGLDLVLDRAALRKALVADERSRCSSMPGGSGMMTVDGGDNGEPGC